MNTSNEIRVNSKIAIRLSEVEFQYARSSGPGGQNVNKVNSQAQLAWDLTKTESLPSDVLRRLKRQEANRITTEGVLRINSQKFRDQERNRKDCLNRLREMIVRAAEPPKKRKKTQTPRWVKEKRLREKRQNSERKQSRRTRYTPD